MKKRILVVLLLMIAAVLLLSSCDFDFVADLLPHEHVHEYGKWNVTTEATCTENGMMCRECECGEKEYKTIAATGHSFTNWYVTHAPTCTENGEEHRTCANCDYYETRTIEANGHSYGDNALSISEDGTTATIDYVCKVCNEELHSPYTGNFVNNNIAYYFENGIKKDIVNDEIEFNGNTYYVIDNEVQINVYIRIENNIYYYGEDALKTMKQ